jgi:hypothetical protein
VEPKKAFISASMVPYLFGNLNGTPLAFSRSETVARNLHQKEKLVGLIQLRWKNKRIMGKPF